MTTDTIKSKVLSFLNPWREARKLREENAHLVDALTDPFVTGLNIGNGTMDIGLEGSAAALMAGAFLGMFEKHPDAKNYIECRFSSKAGDVLVTVIRPQGKTPHQLRREAEQKLAELEALVKRSERISL